MKNIICVLPVLTEKNPFKIIQPDTNSLNCGAMIPKH